MMPCAAPCQGGPVYSNFIHSVLPSFLGLPICSPERKSYGAFLYWNTESLLGPPLGVLQILLE